jgi:hypothetical protein
LPIGGVGGVSACREGLLELVSVGLGLEAHVLERGWHVTILLDRLRRRL